MATTTPNFGWDIPQSTDLVKDGATAIAALGTDIDTALVDLKGGTTGQVLSKNSNTDLDFTWVAQDDSNAIQNAIVDAKGDLISATAADTPARLASSGVNGNVLTVDTTTATGLKWAAPASSGVTWTPRLGANNVAMRSIAYNGSNLWVAVGNSGQLYSSADAITWTSRTSGFGANTIYDVAFGNGLWVAVGNNGTIATSSDGTTWTTRTSNMSTNGIYAVTYANSLWVAVGAGGGSTNTGGITYSTDGITWTRKSQTPTVGTEYNCVVWNGTNWIVGATLSTNNYLYASAPSGTWTAGATGTSATVWKIFWDGTRHTTCEGNVGAANYSTSTTLGTVTEINGDPANSNNTLEGSCIFYYNNKVYFNNGTYIQAMTTQSSQAALVDGLIPFPCSMPASSPYISNNGRAIWVGSQGYIVSSSIGQIWTSF